MEPEASGVAPPLVGRARELAGLVSVLDRAAAGQGGVAIVEGVAGIGKSRLATELVRHADGLGFRVFASRADEFERDRPFGAVVAALGVAGPHSDDGPGGELARMLALEPGESGSAVDVGQPIIDALVAHVEDLAVQRPLLLALDDLQWADVSSINAVRGLARRSKRSALAVVLLRRLHPRVVELDGMFADLAEAGALTFTLQALDPTSAAEVAAHVAGERVVDAALARQLDRAAGNPFYIIELVRSTACADEPEDAMSASLRDTLLRPLAALSDGARRLLEVAAVLGSSFTGRDLAVALGRDIVDLLPELSESTRAGVLIDSGETLDFRHDLIREAVYDSIATSVRVELHRHVGVALGDAGAPLARVAAHMSIGATVGDRLAIAWLHRAALDAAPRAVPVAIALLERALELSLPESPQWALITTDLALSLVSVGRIAEAIQMAKHLLGSELSDEAATKLRRSLAGALFWAGDRAGARELLIADADPTTSDGAIDLAMSAVSRFYEPDLASAHELATKVMRSVTPGHDPLAPALANNVLALVARMRGDIAGGLEFALRAERFFERTTNPLRTFVLGAAYLEGLLRLEADDPAAAEAAFAKAERDILQAGATWQLAFIEFARAVGAFLSGRWGEAAVRVEGALLRAEDSGMRFATAVGCNGLLGVIASHRDDNDRAAAAVSAAESELARTGPQIGIDLLLWAKGLVLEVRGEPVAAAATLSEMWALGQAVGHYPAHRAAGVDAVRLSLEVGDAVRAREIAADLEILAERAGVASALAAARCAMGLIDDNVALLSEARELYGGTVRPFELARTCEAAGSAFARNDDAERAMEALNEAIAIYDELEATRDADRAEASLRELGGRRRRPRPRRRPSAGWESLTDAELRVASLIREGLTNRQIGERLHVSRRTVETHLSHVFPKLGISTRAELAAAAARHIG